MTLSALLMIVAVATPTPPSVSATATPTTCGQAAITITTDQTVEVEFGGDIGDMPPMLIRAGNPIPATLTIARPPGSLVRWVVESYRDDTVYASGEFTMPPCLSAPPVPTTVVYADEPDVGIGTPLTVTRTRWAFWNWTLRRFGGAW